MILSTRTRYGTRAMIELACAYPDRAVSVKEIAENQDLSPKYLEQILAPLKSAGLVKAVRGVHGGYSLKKPPNQTTVLEIFRVLEGSPLLMECVDSKEGCPSEGSCPTQPLWAEIKDAIESILENTTLDALIARWRKDNRSGSDLYQI